MTIEEKLNIVEEIVYEGELYYKDDTGELYQISKNASLPNHPMISFKKYNNKELYETIPDKDTHDKVKRMFDINGNKDKV